MQIRGKERHFLLTVRGRDDIAEKCINHDLGKISESLQASGTTDLMRYMMIVMNRDYEDRQHYDDPSYKQDYLTDDDLQMLTMEEFRKLDDEASTAFMKGMGVNVEAEEPKGKKTGKKVPKSST